MKNYPLASYADAHLFLRDAFEEKRVKNPSFSLRAWAKSLGFKNHSPLTLMIQGKRPIPKKYVPQIAKSLSLNSKQALYFETLVDLKKAKSHPEREMYLARLQLLQPGEKIHVNEVEVFHLLSSPLHFTLLEMTCLKSFQYNLEWIEKKLAQKYSKKEIKEAIQRLLQLKLLKEEKGTILKTHQHIGSKQDILDKGIQEFHRSVLELGKSGIEQKLEEREYGAYCFNLKKENIPEAKKKLRELIRSFITEFESPDGHGDCTYQVANQFFKLTLSKEEK